MFDIFKSRTQFNAVGLTEKDIQSLTTGQYTSKFIVIPVQTISDDEGNIFTLGKLYKLKWNGPGNMIVVPGRAVNKQASIGALIESHEQSRIVAEAFFTATPTDYLFVSSDRQTNSGKFEDRGLYSVKFEKDLIKAIGSGEYTRAMNI